ncbi:AraC family transcriptional regulator of adaptative response/methylated-DNA-[protein]-cysteine methyltransferase [Silvimonas terrae]|uniref:AraC family transcriptional regulator of adaptative response/methylated-DNA-[protein]-cysteine methyltransferase n=1 Tax=Silvimonas terrae TaxID=300266 RepID=A0A840RML4_9NEIS|nr:bifunctional DNA-binding transcriptional regulator/O6-methylguanine-DNA methyltransferase Ada [Silvimonas terrae]MBB5193432.1 AraC family transcriptional regulator of adaptative response/methylated-DNA-[protein]-cysteine methyltransferase [Silvimonas terrae]
MSAQFAMSAKPDTAPDAVFINDDERWDAVQRRDTHADGLFWYGVRTTGVYCRPSCPSRHALRKNVYFYTSQTEAEAAGLRACKRCKPDQDSLASQHAEAVARACRLIETAENLPSLTQLAAAAGLSRYYFHHVFKDITGVTPREYAAAHRAGRVRAELQRADNVTDALYQAGFGSSGRFYEKSTEMLGMKPKGYQRGGEGEAIRFGVGQCTLGAILVAATEQGVCSILLGDEPDELVRDLQDRFPKAQLIGADTRFEQWMAQVIGFVDHPAHGLALPLDIRGTAFQERVWQALRAIPPGSTASYADIAGRIGQPRAVRAVAQACAANKLAVAIPCHRVVRNDGALSGYRWGVERKRALLAREAENTE